MATATASKERSSLSLSRVKRRIKLLEIKRELIYGGPDLDRQRRSVELLMRVLNYRVDPFHTAIIDHQNITQFGERPDDLTLGLRGGGKSTSGTIARAIKYILVDPDVRILLASDTGAAANAFLEEIRGHLMENKTLIEMFGQFLSHHAPSKIGRFREGFATIFQRKDRTVREPTFLCKGIGGQLASFHFDVVFADDLVTLDKSRTKTQRRNLSDWYGSTFIGAMLPHTKTHYLGTRYYPHDLWEDLEDGRPDETEGALKGSTLKLNLVTIQPDGTWVPNHPERFPLHICRRIKKRMGMYHFMAQMQQDTKSGEGIIFNYSDFRWYGNGENMPPAQADMKIIQFHDPTGKKTDKGDFYAGITIGIADVHGERRIWVLDLVHERAGMRKQREYILALAEKWKPYRSGVEAVAMQAGFAEEIQEMTMLPVIPVPVEADKVFRAMRVTHLVEAHKVYFPLPETPVGQRCQVLIDELTVFDEGDNDDCVDAFVGALTLAVFGGPKAASPADDDHMPQDEDLLANYD